MIGPGEDDFGDWELPEFDDAVTELDDADDYEFEIDEDAYYDGQLGLEDRNVALYGAPVETVLPAVPYRVYVDCPHCRATRDTEGDKPGDRVFCDHCHGEFLLVEELP